MAFGAVTQMVPPDFLASAKPSGVPGLVLGSPGETRKQHPLPGWILLTGCLAHPESALLPGTGVMGVDVVLEGKHAVSMKNGLLEKKELGEVFNVLSINLIFHLFF